MAAVPGTVGHRDGRNELLGGSVSEALVWWRYERERCRTAGFQRPTEEGKLPEPLDDLISDGSFNNAATVRMG